MAPGRFAVILLAAGMSPGRGRPKQLLPYLGRTLIEHGARTALASGASEVVVVVGDDDGEIAGRLRHLPVRIVHNRDWAEGMSSSIRVGLAKLSKQPQAAVITLCDQPRVTAAHLRALAERVLVADGPPIVASSYDGILGAPSAFSRSMFPRLLDLRGQAGARHLIREAAVAVEAIHCPEANDEVSVPDGFHPLLDLHRPGRSVKRDRDSSHARAPPSQQGALMVV